ncbi:MAG TPA: transcription antitermination factor NusB [Planctomycetota bacterium]|nr:transcription antitermination factor NusB [Planctomycetota bacterium]
MAAPDGVRSGARLVDNAEDGSSAPRKRTRGRELALQFLYLWDQRGPEVLDSLTQFVIQGDVDPSVQRFARDLVRGVVDNLPGIDQKIIEVAENWDIHRMAVVDRNVLRLGTFELAYLTDIPPKVSINEAIDLAKKFSTAESGAFVNGILDKIRKKHRDKQPEPQPEPQP